MHINQRCFSVLKLVATFILASVSLTVSANHSWNGYHWFWDSGKLTLSGKLPLRVNDNTTVSSAWGSGGVLADVIRIWRACPKFCV